MPARSRLAAVAAATLLSLVAAAPASASFHLMKVKEVFAGAVGNGSAQYVELQMYAPGQNFVGGHKVTIYDRDGLVDGEFTFPGSVGNGANQATILVATTAAATFFGLTPDLVMTPVIDPAGGKACFDAQPVDCVSWGKYSGSTAGVGNPESPASGIPTDYAITRHLGQDGTLAAADDTDDSATDFFSTNPAPRTNAGSTGARGTASVAGGVLTYTSAAGAVDKVTLLDHDGLPAIRNTARAVRPADGSCAQQGASTLECADAGTAVLDLGDMADTALVTAPQPVTLNGGAGADTLTGGPAADVLNGGTENDKLLGGYGPDDLNGGTGTDTVSYATRTAGVAADIDGESDDGSKFDLAGGRRDYVALDVENLIGGAGADALTGDGDANVLDGLAGPDVLRGGLGADTATYAGRSTSVGVKLDGVANDGGPTDERTGSTNRDNLFVENVIGGAGADTITGSAGPNKLTGGLGADTISGLEGADEIFAKDGRADSIVCGADADTLHRDAGLDTFPAVGPTACETVD